MNTQTQSLTLPTTKLNGMTSRVGPSTLITRSPDSQAAMLRQVWATLKAIFSMREELRRMADEFQATRPEHAVRLRQLANLNWRE